MVKNVVLLSLVVLALLVITPVSSQNDIRIQVIDWAPSDDRIAVGNSLGDIEIWNADSGNLLHTLRGHTQEIMTLEWNPDGTHIASGSPDGSIRIWDMLTRQATPIIQFAQPNGSGRAVLDIDWSPDSRFIVAARETGQVIIWDASTGVEQATFSHESFAVSVAWHPDGSIVASGGLNGEVFLWNVTSQSLDTFLPAGGEFNAVGSVAWSPDGTKIAVGTRYAQKANLLVFDYPTGNLLFETLGISNGYVSLLWSPNNAEIAAGDVDRVTVVDATDGNILDTIEANGFADLAAWSPFGGRLVARPLDDQASTRSLNAGFQIIVPSPSLEKLNSLQADCTQTSEIRSVVEPVQSADELKDFIAQIDTLTDEQIDPTCAADLTAVAEALIAEQQ